MNHWKIVRSIYYKLVAKCPEGTLRTQFTKVPSGFSLRCLPEARMCGECSHDPNATGGFLLVSKNYLTAKSTNAAVNVRYLNFDTEQERYNAWQSYLTKFARFCICMDESTKLAPYMGNYTQPWDDQRFYAYFGLTQPEIQLIETVIK